MLRRLEAIAYGMHTGEPGEAPRQTPAAEISWIETERLLAHFAEQNPAYGRGEVEAAVQREELLTRSGLLLPRPNERAAFYHLSFQEFLAAQRIARGSDDRRAMFRERGAVPEWRPTLLFLFAAQIFNRTPSGGSTCSGGCSKPGPRRGKANPAPAVFIAEALELCLAKRYQFPRSGRGLPPAQPGRHRGRGRAAVAAGAGPVPRPAGRPAHPRSARSRAYVEVPAGTYPYGEKGETVEIAAPFRIGRYPVTNSQYQSLHRGRRLSRTENGGRRPVGVAAEGGGHRACIGATAAGMVPTSRWWACSFWEAEACCAWAGGRLPREQEWEAAARGPEGFVYPWGDDWEDGICNTEEAGLSVTSPVGLFPRSRQAELGIEDLAGNVWEWCESRDDDPKDAPPLCGGCWIFDRRMARCARRDRFDASDRIEGASGWNQFVGFRVICPSP